MKDLAYLIGEWESTDADGKVDRVSYEWLNNKSYIMFKNGIYKEIMGWDLTTKQIVSQCYGVSGGQGRIVWALQDDTFKGEAVPAFLDRWGRPLELRVTIVRVDDDTLKLSGKFGDGTWTAESKRVKK